MTKMIDTELEEGKIYDVSVKDVLVAIIRFYGGKWHLHSWEAEVIAVET